MVMMQGEQSTAMAEAQAKLLATLALFGEEEDSEDDSD